MNPEEGTVDDKLAMDGAGNLYIGGTHSLPPNDTEYFLAISKYAPLSH